MENMTLEQVTLADLDALRAISIETFTDTFGSYNTPEDLAVYLETSYDPAKLKEEIQTEDSYFYFVKDATSGEVLAYLKLNLNDAQTEAFEEASLEIERIYVRPAFKRRGIGQFLMTHAIETAKSMGLTHIWLGVWEHNENAQKFYAKNGFQRRGEHVFMVGDDRQVDYILMKDISA
ncbi:GNAT family N-acetyltransferase [Aerococcus agrisoli]|uniref:GNAT family N-acetyltransferase n=1 Tax=Aerococcus agrisoli TaxID=2487350 RepID=A0A3N4GJW5_9LACT|nr:GNAT family N-acetyltransferase [Aerococcus agrisoli]RPA60886.1 GNAT family N-acetyltransferase [Aerococcus agrisoli]